MPKPYHPVDTQHVLHLLRQWLKTAAPPEGVDWLDGMRDTVNDGADDGVFLGAFAAAPRRVGRNALHLRADDRAEAERVRPGWRPQTWTADQAARTVLLLVYDDSDAAAYGAMLAAVLARGPAEAASVYRALPLLPYPDRHAALAVDALRADDTLLFEALALHNPYPADTLAEPAWNRLVMRAVFLDAPLDAIEGLERRANPVLAHEIRDYARLRRAAGHALPPTLWRA
ncbi:MAG TPA: EboA domain-containing protein, partial [Azospirillum sp.]